MNVKVKLFSGLRLMTGKKIIELEVDDGSTVEQTLKVLCNKFGDSLKFKIVDTGTNHYKMALIVNNILSDDSVVLKDGDTLAIIPPVAGG